MRIINFVRRLFRRAPADVGLLQFASPDVKPYVRPSVDEQAADHGYMNPYMQRYYTRLQQPPRPGDWATGGIITGSSTPGDDSIPAFLSPGGPVSGPDQAEALGLTVEARRLREAGQ